MKDPDTDICHTYDSYPKYDKLLTRGNDDMGRILVVDDDSAVRMFVFRALAQRGHSTEQATDSDSALARLEQAGDFDLLVSDIVMPGQDGVGLAHEARRRWPGLRVLLMTGYAAGRDQTVSADGPAQDILLKPFSLKTVCDTVETLLNQEPG